MIYWEEASMYFPECSGLIKPEHTQVYLSRYTGKYLSRIISCHFPQCTQFTLTYLIPKMQFVIMATQLCWLETCVHLNWPRLWMVPEGYQGLTPILSKRLSPLFTLHFQAEIIWCFFLLTCHYKATCKINFGGIIVSLYSGEQQMVLGMQMQRGKLF